MEPQTLSEPEEHSTTEFLEQMKAVGGASSPEEVQAIMKSFDQEVTIEEAKEMMDHEAVQKAIFSVVNAIRPFSQEVALHICNLALMGWPGR